MIGQHPDAYAFAELDLTIRETAGELLDLARQTGHHLGPPGLLRVLAELEFGGQSAEHVLSAANWLEDRVDWRSRDVMDHLLALAGTASGADWCVVSAPEAAKQPKALSRMQAWYPDARFLHLNRHPADVYAALVDLISGLPTMPDDVKARRIESARSIWLVVQRVVLRFTTALDPGDYRRVRAEDVLSEPHASMRGIAEWLGLSLDDAAIESMLRPEGSPFSRPGPVNARTGHDPDFLHCPELPVSAPEPGDLESFFHTRQGASLDESRRKVLRQLAHRLGYR